MKAKVQAEPPTCWGAYVLFADAAPVGPHNFFVGLCVPSGGVSVPLLGDYLASSGVMGLAAGSSSGDLYEVAPACVGSDSTVARCQVHGQRSATFCAGQQRIPGALFWLRRWSGIPIAGFYVPSGRNPADPPSRVHEFDSMISCLGSAR